MSRHEGPVWEVAWAHPKFGVLLASCSYDKQVIVHREDPATGVWAAVYAARNHESSVNSIAWAPHQQGLVLACASSDGFVSVCSFVDNKWEVKKIRTGSMSCNSVSWAPHGHLGSTVRPTFC